MIVTRGGRTRSKCHMTSITLFTCHSAITPGGAWLGTVLVQRECGGKGMARSTAKNNSSLTWATRFSVCANSGLPNVG